MEKESAVNLYFNDLPYLDYQTNHMQKCNNLEKRNWSIVTIAMDKESQLKYIIMIGFI